MRLSLDETTPYSVHHMLLSGKAVKPRGKVQSLLTSTLQSVINLLHRAARPPDHLFWKGSVAQQGWENQTFTQRTQKKHFRALCGKRHLCFRRCSIWTNLVQQVKLSERQKVTRVGVASLSEGVRVSLFILCIHGSNQQLVEWSLQIVI